MNANGYHHNNRMNNIFNKQTDPSHHREQKPKPFSVLNIKESNTVKELKINKEPKKHKIWKIVKYAYSSTKFVDNNSIELPLDELLIALETDNGYHMRINSDSNYIFYGDCDGFKLFHKNIKGFRRYIRRICQVNDVVFVRTLSD